MSIRDEIIGDFQSLAEKELVWNSLRALGEKATRDVFDYMYKSHPFFYDGIDWVSVPIKENITITGQAFLAKYTVGSAMPATPLTTTTPVSVCTKETCPDLLRGHQPGCPHYDNNQYAIRRV